MRQGIFAILFIRLFLTANVHADVTQISYQVDLIGQGVQKVILNPQLRSLITIGNGKKITINLNEKANSKIRLLQVYARRYKKQRMRLSELDSEFSLKKWDDKQPNSVVSPHMPQVYLDDQRVNHDEKLAQRILYLLNELKKSKYSKKDQAKK